MEGKDLAPGYPTLKSHMIQGRTDSIEGMDLNSGSHPETIFVTEIDNDNPFMEDMLKPRAPKMPSP